MKEPKPTPRRPLEIGADTDLFPLEPYHVPDAFIFALDDTLERRVPTSEERDRMDQLIYDCVSLLHGFPGKWLLDGALNISLAKGEFIGVHKDIDISVEVTDMRALEAQAARSGYGLFVAHADEAERVRGARVTRHISDGNIILAPVDQTERLIPGLAQGVIDVHLIGRDRHGRALGAGEAVLPESWMKPQIKRYHGLKLHLSHPARTAYYKLGGQRAYDMSDVHELARMGSLTIADVDQIEAVVESMKPEFVEDHLIRAGEMKKRVQQLRRWVEEERSKSL